MYPAEQKRLPNFIKPMLATPGGKPFDNEEWIFEIKWDGYRAIADLSDGLQFYSRNGLSYLGKYSMIMIESGLRKQPEKMVLDGEIVAYNRQGIPDFQLLQHSGEQPAPPLFITFSICFF